MEGSPGLRAVCSRGQLFAARLAATSATSSELSALTFTGKFQTMGLGGMVKKPHSKILAALLAGASFSLVACSNDDSKSSSASSSASAQPGEGSTEAPTVDRDPAGEMPEITFVDGKPTMKTVKSDPPHFDYCQDAQGGRRRHRPARRLRHRQLRRILVGRTAPSLILPSIVEHRQPSPQPGC